jgi:hypothetical protein
VTATRKSQAMIACAWFRRKAPRWIIGCHASNQLAKLGRNARAARQGLVPPENPPASAVPADHRLRSNQHQTGAPIAQARQRGQADARGGIDAPRFDAALLEKRKLPPKDEVFGGSGQPWPAGDGTQRHGVGNQAHDHLDEGDHGFLMPSALSSVSAGTIG